ncbi:MAG TPA: hypothetical protein VJY34_02640 [Roseiarcus sp.]|nr:hypothetical protein [Roseiarcus sp.]
MEQSVAIYPRVVLDQATMGHWKHEFRIDGYGQGPPHPQLEGLVKRDRDGQEILDFFNPEWGPNFLQWTEFVPATETIPIDPIEFLKKASERIEDGRAKHSGNLKVLAKYQWLATELNERVAALHLNYSLPAQPTERPQ